MRDKTNVEVRYNEDEDNRLEESKEEDIPLTQIAKIVEKHGDYWIYHKSTLEESEEEIEKNPEGKLWNVVKHSKVTEGDPYKITLESSRLTKGGFEELGYTIMPNDVIKLGRVRFKVREIVSPAYAMLRREEGHRLMKLKEDQNQIDLKEEMLGKRQLDLSQHEIAYDPGVSVDLRRLKNTPANILHSEEVVQGSEPLIIRPSSERSNRSGMPVCRICLSEEGDDPQKNPLFSPCKCAGTMKYIHLECLQEWLNSRMFTKETVCTVTYYWKNLECELCQSSFPNYVRTENLNDVSLHVVKYCKPTFQENEEPSYMVLESITNAAGKVIHVVNMLKTDGAKIGRGHDVDVRITDISVSRLHALIKKTPKGYFYVQDNKSKFGTLTLIKHPIQLHPVEPNFIQAGRTMLEIQTRLPIKMWSSCFCNLSPKAKSRRFSMHQRQGMGSVNGKDYYPEEFLNLKKKMMAKILEEDELIKEVLNDQLVDNEMAVSPSQRHMLQEEFNTISQVLPGNPEPLPSPNHREILRQLQLIPEDSLEIQGSLGISQELAGNSQSLFQIHAGSLLLPSLISRHRQPIQVYDNDNEEERNAINLIHAELENSLSRLIDDHNRSDLLDESLLNQHESPRGRYSPYIPGNIEEIKEIDEENFVDVNSRQENFQEPPVISIVNQQALPINLFSSATQQRNNKNELKTMNSPDFGGNETQALDFNAPDTTKRNSQQFDTQALEFALKVHEMKNIFEVPTLRVPDYDNVKKLQLVPQTSEDQSLPTGRFQRIDQLQSVNINPSHGGVRASLPTVQMRQALVGASNATFFSPQKNAGIFGSPNLTSNLSGTQAEATLDYATKSPFVQKQPIPSTYTLSEQPQRKINTAQQMIRGGAQFMGATKKQLHQQSPYLQPLADSTVRLSKNASRDESGFHGQPKERSPLRNSKK